MFIIYMVLHVQAELTFFGAYYIERWSNKQITFQPK